MSNSLCNWWWSNKLVLTTDGGVYYSSPFEVAVPITIKAAPGLAVKPTIVVKELVQQNIYYQ